MVPEGMFATLGSHTRGDVLRCFGWRKEPITASCCHPRRGIPREETQGARLGPGRALGPEGEGRGCKLQNGTDAFSLPNPQCCPNLGAGTASSWDINRHSHSSQKVAGSKKDVPAGLLVVAGGGGEAGAAVRGTGVLHPPAIQPPGMGSSVEGVLVFHCPGPAPGTVSLVVVLGTGSGGLWPALSTVAAAPGAQGTL